LPLAQLLDVERVGFVGLRQPESVADGEQPAQRLVALFPNPNNVIPACLVLVLISFAFAITSSAEGEPGISKT